MVLHTGCPLKLLAPHQHVSEDIAVLDYSNNWQMTVNNTRTRYVSPIQLDATYEIGTKLCTLAHIPQACMQISRL